MPVLLNAISKYNFYRLQIGPYLVIILHLISILKLFSVRLVKLSVGTAGYFFYRPPALHQALIQAKMFPNNGRFNFMAFGRMLTSKS